MVREGWMGRAQRIFKAARLLRMILWWWIRVIIHLSKPTEFTAPRVNLQGNYGLWLVMMCPSRFISCNKCATWVGDVDCGKGYACVGWGGKGIWEISVSSAQFFLNMNPKLLWKLKSIFKKKAVGCGNKEVVADLRRAVSMRCRVQKPDCSETRCEE